MSSIPVPDSVAAAVKIKAEDKNIQASEAIERYVEKMSRLEIPVDTWRNINMDKLAKRFDRAIKWRPTYINPLTLDKYGLFKDYMRALNDTSDVVEYEKPNKYNFKLTGVK